MKHSFIFSFLISDKSREEKPGVSAIKPPYNFNNSTCLVVCLPLPSALDIGAVSISRFLSSAFNRVDLPTPL